jgi:hypothetical protein
MDSRRSVLKIAVALIAGVAIAGCSTPATRLLCASSNIGKGTVSSYAEFDRNGAPKAIGIAFHPGALQELPTAHSDGRYCFDRDKDGKVDVGTECFGSHGWVIPLPSEAARRADIPFKWVGLNWNPHGHIPPGVYDLPHFDVHFYIEPIEKVLAIGAGACGPEYVSCDHFTLATRPLPSNYVHADYTNVDAVAPAMGNHLIDLTGPEFNKQKFTRSWIYGVYDGRVTFYEEMLSREFLLSHPDTCFPLKSPPAVAISGYYPTQSCTRYLPQADEYTVSMEGFVLREATGPAPN